MATLASAPASGKHKQKRSIPSIDMTPMVDLAFLLLTFFVMTTTLMKHSVIELAQPVSDPNHPEQHTPIKPEKVLNVVLAENDQVYWYMGLPGSSVTKTDFSHSGLRRILSEKQNTVPGLYVFIKAHDQSHYQNMIDLLDEIIITDTKRYSIVDLAAEDQQLAMNE